MALAHDGKNVVVHVAKNVSAGKETVEAVEAAGARASLVVGDLAVPEIAAQVVKEAAAAFGRLDMVVNNAAIRPEVPFSELTFEDWRQVFGICLDAVFLVSKNALPHLLESECASIINIGGLTAHTGAANRVHVISAKAGLVGLTKAMAHDLSPQGVTVNCVSPGLVDTVRTGDSVEKDPHHHATRTNLLGRRGSPEEIAASVAFLCSENARYITGETLHVNGGAYLS